ncbi:MAG: ABC transporter ATP-binding protein/permease [Chitinophagaceae bacterium]|nr:ABC transporter ATP-binding protein/permease [Chitinophagaceae bacterium]
MPSTIILLVSLFASIQLAMGTLNQYTNHIEQLFSQEVADAFSLRIITKASHVEYAHFENPAFHNSLYLAQQQARFRITQLLPAINATISNAMSLVFLVLFFVSIKAYFFLAIFVLAIPITLKKWLQGKRSTDLEFKLAPKERESGYLFQLMTGIQWAKELRTFRFGKTFQSRFQALRKEINLEKSLIQKKSLQQNMLAEFFEVSALGLAIGYLAIKTVSKSIGLGTFILYLQGIQRMQTSSKAFFQSMLQVFQLRSFVNDLYGFFELSEREKKSTEQDFPGQLDQLRIESLSFGYPNQTQPIISGINLEATRGQIIAIVGENGSGKSTLVKLLAGFYTPEKGSIQLNGTDIKDIEQHQFYQQTCFFFQDYEKYFLTAGQNIHFEYNTTDLVEKKAAAAGQTSGASIFIEKLAKGYATKMGSIFEGSEQLSGGQWQKLTIARVFYKDAQLVVLDEPSSALDAFAELNLYEKIKTELKDKIVILISHRLYNLKIADKIHVMHDGKIVQSGKFEQLTVEDGLFKSMYEKQRI